MDDFFHMHNRMAQQFFAQAERDFQRFVEPPRPVAQRRQYAPRARNTGQQSEFRHPGNRRSSGHSHHTNSNRGNYHQNRNSNNRSASSYVKKASKRSDRGTMRREGIVAARPSTTSSPPKKYLPIRDRERLVRSVTPSEKSRNFPSSKTPPRAKRISSSQSIVPVVENALQGGWVERTLTPIRGTLKHCGTEVMMENKGNKFYVVTYEPGQLKKVLANAMPKSFDFKISIKACNSNQIVNCKLRVHVVLAYAAPNKLLCLTGDFNEKHWRLDRFEEGSKRPTKLFKQPDDSLRPNKFYSVECQVRGALLYVKVNDRYLFDSDTGEHQPCKLLDGEISHVAKVGLMCSRSKMIFKDVSFDFDGGASGQMTQPVPKKRGHRNNQDEADTGKVLSLPPVVSGGRRETRGTSNTDYDDKLKEIILRDLLLKIPKITWNDIVGLETAKRTLKEAVILPALRPDLFKGLRSPPKGVLLFGPPGTGKTMLGKCVAAVSQSSFFCISASTLTSKYHGEGEKLVRKLFDVARELQPSVIFIDEIDSLLSSRHSREHDAVRRLKTEFLIQFDGVSTNANDRVLVMGATNRPQDLDDAVLRRMEKRIYIPLPDEDARKTLLKQTGGKEDSSAASIAETGTAQNTSFDLNEEELNDLVVSTEGYSCSDIVSLCREASFGPLRDLGDDIMTAKATDMRSINYGDFKNAKSVVHSSVSGNAVGVFVEFNREYGGGGTGQ